MQRVKNTVHTIRRYTAPSFTHFLNVYDTNSQNIESQKNSRKHLYDSEVNRHIS